MSELESRFRAARAYAGLTQEEMATILGFSLAKMQRIELGSRGVADYEAPGIIRKFSEATGFPVDFFTADLERLGGGAQSDDGFAQVQRRVEEIAKQLDAMRGESQRRWKDSQGDIEKCLRGMAHDRGRLTRIERNLAALGEVLLPEEEKAE